MTGILRRSHESDIRFIEPPVDSRFTIYSTFHIIMTGEVLGGNIFNEPRRKQKMAGGSPVRRPSSYIVTYSSFKKRGTSTALGSYERRGRGLVSASWYPPLGSALKGTNRHCEAHQQRDRQADGETRRRTYSRTDRPHTLRAMPMKRWN